MRRSADQALSLQAYKIAGKSGANRQKSGFEKKHKRDQRLVGYAGKRAIILTSIIHLIGPYFRAVWSIEPYWCEGTELRIFSKARCPYAHIRIQTSATQKRILKWYYCSGPNSQNVGSIENWIGFPIVLANQEHLLVKLCDEIRIS